MLLQKGVGARLLEGARSLETIRYKNFRFINFISQDYEVTRIGGEKTSFSSRKAVPIAYWSLSVYGSANQLNVAYKHPVTLGGDVKSKLNVFINSR